MTSVLVPDEAASHLGAILVAFNREIFGGFLEEAEALAGLGQAASAILIAGTVLEYLERSPAAGLVPAEMHRQIVEWRELRNQVAHGSAVALTMQEAKQVIDGVRRIIKAASGPGEYGHYSRSSAGAAQTVKGKYSHVPTSSADFMRRKREELEWEDRG